MRDPNLRPVIGQSELERIIAELQQEVRSLRQTVGSDTDWINLTYINGWFTYAGWPDLAVRRVNGLTYMRGMVQNNDSTGVLLNDPVAIIPAGMRPGTNMITAAMTGGGLGRLDIYTDGTIIFPANTLWGTWLSTASKSWIAEQ